MAVVAGAAVAKEAATYAATDAGSAAETAAETAEAVTEAVKAEVTGKVDAAKAVGVQVGEAQVAVMVGDSVEASTRY